MRESTVPIRLTEGGITGDTEVLTARGPRRISRLDEGDSVYALDPTTGISKLKPLREVHQFDFEGEVVHLQARRVDLVLHPQHRIPYRTEAFPTIRFQKAVNIDEREEYRFVNSWEMIPSTPVESVDLTEILD